MLLVGEPAYSSGGYATGVVVGERTGDALLVAGDVEAVGVDHPRAVECWHRVLGHGEPDRVRAGLAAMIW